VYSKFLQKNLNKEEKQVEDNSFVSKEEILNKINLQRNKRLSSSSKVLM
jgi:hypothetical protein